MVTFTIIETTPNEAARLKYLLEYLKGQPQLYGYDKALLDKVIKQMKED